ncbi:hypothetical protein [Saccharothrix sp. ST-888]|uniref:hypothetical protein n=1 Tax=Saccharothrix sp. ST-888 TaxID=1427391 RepID=UPI0005ED16FF|nr:hypothetical protein [Saccharothrix sp. ST-888]KJK55529.1 hypothetical protein UK12_28095 [Saccharothrix sp. ST-888]
MTVTQLITIGLAVFFTWDALARPLLALAAPYLPDPVRTAVQYGAVFGLAYAAHRLAPQWLTTSLATGAVVGLVEHLVQALRRRSGGEIQAVQLRRRAGGSSGFPWP